MAHEFCQRYRRQTLNTSQELFLLDDGVSLENGHEPVGGLISRSDLNAAERVERVSTEIVLVGNGNDYDAGSVHELNLTKYQRSGIAILKQVTREMTG
jgi:hypothetical protein